ncbi:LacI family DNA-binding transcriptional regulator [Streptomyces sp. H39-S7]|uniref:LacI family DNA-binding transcriptional regulator n=1 Tax=Streptomyces sp. H39-S7 TaxID=3004357 RepID=UPI0022AF442D|nr:LacI family DNA-binding transcriptional regulator [Streptomyces sp. H39-S7]MCZ4124590.1 LacI family DNA-binding transcriptional regulator [Streptomyces sp. H39-S7]
MTDIARRAGVTKGAVSFALNGKRGVSEHTRKRVLAIAEELGWQPNSAARALSDGRAGSYGLVVDRPARILGIEPFFMSLISGMQTELSGKGVALLFTVAEDAAAQIATHREWWARRRVDGVFLVDVRFDDPRIADLEELGLPAVVIGPPAGSGGLPAVWSDEGSAVRLALSHFAELGHRNVARVAGPAGFVHTQLRGDAFRTVAAELGLRTTTIEADYTGEQGAAATRELLERPDRPTAVLYDNDVMAVSGLSAAHHLGVRVPEEISMVAWDDSALCELIRPGLTALRRDIADYGARAARLLGEVVAGNEVEDLQVAEMSLVERGSTAAAPSDG